MANYKVGANKINIYYEMEGNNANVIFLHGVGTTPRCGGTSSNLSKKTTVTGSLT